MRRIYLVIGLLLLALPHLSYGFDSLPTAIPNGTDGQVLTARTSDTPHWAAPSGGQYATGVYTSGSNAASGTYVVTSGLSFTPKMVQMNCARSGVATGYASWGFSDGTNNSSMYDYNSAAWTVNPNSSIYVSDATNSYIGTIGGFVSGGFSITITKSNTPGVLSCMYIAFG